ncbi:hypothetical protein ACEXQD_06210 [Herbiconiux sp. P15]|uniref:hypothetical protein n=1 Tax=Herbiconiux liukaitaii TaxID=3342799 RepID=UPI0035B83FDD
MSDIRGEKGDESRLRAEAAASLIQRRMALERRRTVAVAMLVFGVVMIGLGLATFGIDPTRPFSWAPLLVPVVFVAMGVTRLGRALKQLARFTAEFGVDAGRRRPVSR